MILQCDNSGQFKPHRPGIFPAVCVDMIDLGVMASEYQGEVRMMHKLKLVFETEELTEDGRRCTVSRIYSASLHPKAKLAGVLGTWRGRPVVPGERIDLKKLVGACCTLMVSHQTNMAGKTYASIDAISKPTRKVTPSGGYDPAAAREKIGEWLAKMQGGTGAARMAGGQGQVAGGQAPVTSNPPSVVSNQAGGASPRPSPYQSVSTPQPSPGLRPPSPAPAGEGESGEGTAPFPQSGGRPPQSKTAPIQPAASADPFGDASFDPEIGF